MDFIKDVIDILLNVDQYLADIIKSYKFWTYLILFIIIFAETGFVVTPFLPGDPLLFAAGALIANGNTGLNIFLLGFILILAAISGNTVNYYLGRSLGPKVFKPENKILKLSYYESTQDFFNKHGGKAVIFSRFFAILRTFVPFVSGVIRMPMGRYTLFNIIGAVAWISSFLMLGYLFGNIPAVKDNFSWAVLFITLLSSLPPIVGAIYSKKGKKANS
ncbi:VTT domain-containing protein [Pseudopedobacter beijingensis]|uniref:VTT domain-containing protein n=1 Tax=Pseudopedobacter beijingensis TaxID=1207056 RepID=A0ABW4IFQ3_9SPHI